MKEAHAGRAVFEALDRSGVLDEMNAGPRQGAPDDFGDLMVLAHQDAGAISTRWTREPKALKVEATCTPVAPAPMTSSDDQQRRRHRGKVPRVAVRRG